MRKLFVYLGFGIAVVGALGVAAMLIPPDRRTLGEDEILAAFEEGRQYGGLTIDYPPDEAVFPPEIAPATLRWSDSRPRCNLWLVTIAFSDGGDRLSSLARATWWTPSDEQWEVIKRRSVQRPARVTVLGVDRAEPGRILSGGSISISTSQDKVGACLFYREVNLPFSQAVKDPAAHIRWRLGDISAKEPPPVVLEKLPVCGNCHSFSADGRLLGMDVDYANDKGSYAIEAVAEEMVLDSSDIITWSDYNREDGELTFGLLSQISPDGKYVVGTVKDRSVFVATPDLTFSQLFFPIKGILAIYRRETGTFHALPGADDKRFVQSNPTWSPDGKYIVFARSKAYEPEKLRDVTTVLVSAEEVKEFLEGGKTFQYDLYRIPFNDGKGGRPEPIEGASNNNMSNYFPKFSPDGKWIVFCKAKSFMLLQPDSELYIIPAAGGQARRLRCNTSRMNSWHSWSPNGKWLVFSSKVNSPYTQLLLTHIDEQGRSTPPVLLANFTAENRAANIPEFVNLKPGAIKRISTQFIDDHSYIRRAYPKFIKNDFKSAAEDYRKALEFNPDNLEANFRLGRCLMALGKLEEATSCFAKAVQLKPHMVTARCNLGLVLVRQGRTQEALETCREAVRLRPDHFEARKTLGLVLLAIDEIEEAKTHLAEALRLAPNDPHVLYCYGAALELEGSQEAAVRHYYRALELDPNLYEALISLASIRATARSAGMRNGEEALQLARRACVLTGNNNPSALHALAAALAEVGRFADAAQTAEIALDMARANGAVDLADTLARQIELYRQQTAFRMADKPDHTLTPEHEPRTLPRPNPGKPPPEPPDPNADP